MSRNKTLTGMDLMNIRKMYEDGVPYAEIAGVYNVCIKTIRNHIDVMIDLGQTTRRIDKPGRRSVLTQTVRKKPTPKPKEKIELQGDGWIRCTRAVALTCRYGCTPYSAGTNLCNYILIPPGHPRGCPWERCTKYEKVTDEAPRLYKESGLNKFNPDMKRKGRKKKCK